MIAFAPELGRDLARAQGWYDVRRRVQTIFVLGLGVAGLGTLAVLLVLTRHLLPRHAAAFVGMVMLACLFAARASSFHDVESALGRPLLGVYARAWLELAGIACIGLCALANSWWRLAPRARVQSPLP